MRRVIDRDRHRKCRYEIQINGQWATVATLLSNPFSFRKGAPDWELYFYQYGEENEGGNGNNHVCIFKTPNMYDAIDIADKIVAKKLYKLMDNIFTSLKGEIQEVESTKD